MNYLVMGQYQDIIFAVKISQAESHPVVVIFAEIGIQLHVLQKIVHPAHVPLKGKAQSVLLRMLCHIGPGGRFFRNHQYAEIASLDDSI